MQKVLLVAFNGEQMCFMHVLLNGLNIKELGIDVKIIVEGAATKQVAVLADPQETLAGLYNKVKEAGLIEGVCKACANKTGALAAAEAQGLTLLSDMSGHPGLGKYIQEGYSVITL